MAGTSESKKIQFPTFVIVGFSTLGLPEQNQAQITKWTFVAIKTEELLNTKRLKRPIEEQKSSLSFKQEKDMTVNAEPETQHDLNTEILDSEYRNDTFDVSDFNSINTFFNELEKPICLIAHNGLRFEFPILRTDLLSLNVNFESNIYCADSLYGFFDIMEGRGLMEGVNRYAGRYYEPGNFIQSYTYRDLYQRTFPNDEVPDSLHNASRKCNMILKLFTLNARELVEWFNIHNILFSEVDVSIVSGNRQNI